MAKVKVKINQKDFDKIRDKILKKARTRLPSKIERIIKSRYAKGISPVERQGRFVKYSQAYQDQIKKGVYKSNNKRTRPVNLKLSGNMLRTFFVAAVGRGFKIGIRHKLADIHNRRGAGKSKTTRRLLPTEPGENFTKSVIRDIIKELKKIIGANA